MNIGNNIQSNIKVGELDVVDSGIVTSPGNRPINIQIAENVEVEFRFDFEGDSDPSYSAEPIDGKLVIKLENFQAGVVMGGTTPPIGLLEPISIGHLFDRELSVLFQVSSSKGDDEPAHSTLYYNFYLGESLELEESLEGESNGSE